MEKLNIEEIKRLAFLKFKLSGKRSMNTFIFSQAKNNKLTNEQIDELLAFLENKIFEYIEQNENIKISKVKFTCNISKKILTA